MQPLAVEQLMFEASWFAWSPVGAVILEPPPAYEPWERAVLAALDMRGSSTWALVDLYLAGELHFGEHAAQAISVTRISPKRLANILWVGRRFPHERRHALLSFSHHEAVAGLIGNPGHPEWTQQAWYLLGRAEEQQWPVEVLEQEVREVRGPSDGNGPGPVKSLAALRDRLRNLENAEELETVAEHLTAAIGQLDMALSELKAQAKEGAL